MTAPFIPLAIAALAAWTASPSPAPAATPHVTFGPKNSVPLDYCGSSLTSQPKHRCNVFLPVKRAPMGGYPVIVSMSLSNFASSNLFTGINASHPGQEFLGSCLEQGIAVVHCTATVTVTQPSGVTAPDEGIFYPPGWTFGTSYEPYQSDLHHFSERDAVMVVQYVRELAQTPGHPLEAVNGQRLAVHGSSAGAFSMQWVGFGPDRAAQTFPTPIGQESQSTVPQAVVVERGGTWVPAFDQLIFPVPHLPSLGNPMRGAENLADVDPCIQVEASAHHYVPTGFQVPTLMYYDQAHVSTNYTPTGQGCVGPILPYKEEILIHSRWSGLSWKNRFSSAEVILEHVAPLSDVHPAPPASMYDHVIPDRGTRGKFMATWLRATL